MSCFESALELKSFRSCEDTIIPRDKIGKILEAGRNAPSPGNVQSMEFIVVEDEGKKHMLSDAADDDRIDQAPTAIILIADIDRMARKVGRSMCHDVCNAEAAAAVQSMRLVANEEGLGSCWISGFDPEFVADQFSVPSGKQPLSVLALGFTDDEIEKPAKFGLGDICFYDEYGHKVSSVFDGIEWKGLHEEKHIYSRKAEGIISKLRRSLAKYL